MGDEEHQMEDVAAEPAAGAEDEDQGLGDAAGKETAAATPADAMLAAAAKALESSPILQHLREWVTAILGVAITGIFLWLLVAAFYGPTADRKDILEIGLGLVGVILGYYFGRVPVERRAEQAEAATQQAQVQAGAAADAAGAAATQRDLARAKADDARSTVASVLEKLGAAEAGRRSQGEVQGAWEASQVASFTEDVVTARASLEDLQRRLG